MGDNSLLKLEAIAKSAHEQMEAYHREAISLLLRLIIVYGKLAAIHALGDEYNGMFNKRANRFARFIHRLMRKFSEMAIKNHAADIEKLTLAGLSLIQEPGKGHVDMPGKENRRALNFIRRLMRRFGDVKTENAGEPSNAVNPGGA